MLKISPPFCLFSLLLLAICTNLAVVNGNICREELGICESDCDLECKERHSLAENPHGNCDRIGHMVVCNCYYSCIESPPRPRPGKVCHAGLGQCSARCNSDCCNANCARLHNGGQGFCDTNVGVSLCQCSYPCQDK